MKWTTVRREIAAWHPWFAWFPVRVNVFIKECGWLYTQFVWWEYVERRMRSRDSADERYWEYQLPRNAAETKR